MLPFPAPLWLWTKRNVKREGEPTVNTSVRMLLTKAIVIAALATGGAIAFERPASAECIRGTFCCGEADCSILYVNRECDAWYCWDWYYNCCTYLLPNGNSPCNTCEYPIIE